MGGEGIQRLFFFGFLIPTRYIRVLIFKSASAVLNKIYFVFIHTRYFTISEYTIKSSFFSTTQVHSKSHEATENLSVVQTYMFRGAVNPPGNLHESRLNRLTYFFIVKFFWEFYDRNEAYLFRLDP